LVKVRQLRQPGIPSKGCTSSGVEIEQ